MHHVPSGETVEGLGKQARETELLGRRDISHMCEHLREGKSLEGDLGVEPPSQKAHEGQQSRSRIVPAVFKSKKTRYLTQSEGRREFLEGDVREESHPAGLYMPMQDAGLLPQIRWAAPGGP